MCSPSLAGGSDSCPAHVGRAACRGPALIAFSLLWVLPIIITVLNPFRLPSYFPIYLILILLFFLANNTVEGIWYNMTFTGFQAGSGQTGLL